MLRGVQNVLNGIRLCTEGKIKQGYKLMANSTVEDLDIAVQIVERRGAFIARLMAIGNRHGADDDETVLDVVARAAMAGDADAKMMLHSGELDLKVI